MSALKKALDNAKIKRKYVTLQDIRAIDAMKQAMEEDKVKVTCMGLYNHGKSSLLNALIKDFDGKTFKTGDIRETIVNKQVQYKNFLFVDTPGLNAQKNDDKRVMDAVKESDINIFVHNVNTGEFVASEVAFFHRVKRHWRNSKEFIDRTIFVLSRIDESSSDDDVKDASMKMRKQIKEIFGVDAYILPVSSKDYVDGMIEEEEELVGISNIPLLEDILNNFYTKRINPIRETKKDRLKQYYDSLIKKLSGRLEEEKLELSKLQTEKKKYQDALKRDIDKIKSTLKQKYEMVKEV